MATWQMQEVPAAGEHCNLRREHQSKRTFSQTSLGGHLHWTTTQVTIDTGKGYWSMTAMP